MTDAAADTGERLELTIERELKHPPEAVFAAWTNSEALRKWMGPGEITAPESEIDAREGGSLTVPMVSPDGTVFTARGEIVELVKNRRLRFTWAWDQEDGTSGQLMEITLDFIPVEAGTRLVLRQTNFIDATAREQHQEGWSGTLVKLEDYLGG